MNTNREDALTPEEQARAAYDRLDLSGDRAAGLLAVLPFGDRLVLYPVDVPAARWLGEHATDRTGAWGVGAVVEREGLGAILEAAVADGLRVERG